MHEQLLFHEKCNQDIQQILERIRVRDGDHAAEKAAFLVRLTETYQLLFESPTSSSGHIYEPDMPWGERFEKRILKIHSYPYIVVYTRLSSRSLVVLGIININSTFCPIYD